MASTATPKPWRFAPLGKPAAPADVPTRKLEGIVFDVDGTLWQVDFVLAVNP